MYFPVSGVEVSPLIPFGVAFIVSVFTSMGGVSGAFLFADKVSAHGFGPAGDFVQKFAQRFGLNESEVESFMDEMHKEHMQDMQTGFEDRLTEAVSSGDITDDQKQLIGYLSLLHAELLRQSWDPVIEE